MIVVVVWAHVIFAALLRVAVSPVFDHGASRARLPKERILAPHSQAV